MRNTETKNGGYHPVVSICIVLIMWSQIVFCGQLDLTDDPFPNTAVRGESSVIGGSLPRSFCGFTLGESLDSRIRTHERTYTGYQNGIEYSASYLTASISGGDKWNGLQIIEVSTSIRHRSVFKIKLYRSLEKLTAEDKQRCYEATLRRLRTVFKVKNSSRGTFFGDLEHEFVSGNVKILFRYSTPGAILKDGSLHLTVTDKSLEALAYSEKREFKKF